jgi:glycosyltransferase involved in cell wall biosynthesis
MTNKNRPFFSIIIPVYKTEPFLEECLKSVLDQEFKDFECLVINDGSPGVALEGDPSSQYWHRKDFKNTLIPETNSSKENHTKYIFDNLVGRDSRFKYFEKLNEGLGPTKNFGLNKAAGKYLVILDSDDFISTNFLLQASKKLESKKPNEVYFNTLKNYKNGEFFDFSDFQKFVPHPNNLKTILVFPTWTVTPINYFWGIDYLKSKDVEYRFKNKGEDTIFVVENLLNLINEYGKVRFEPIQNSFYSYRQTDSQMTKQDSFEIDTFTHVTDYFEQIEAEFKKAGVIIFILYKLYIHRFRLYRLRLQTNNPVTKIAISLYTKMLTVISIIISKI